MPAPSTQPTSPWRVERRPDGSGVIVTQLHPGQMEAMNSEARFTAIISGTQSGKTSYAPIWLEREIRRRGPGDYLAVTSTFPLLIRKMLPEFLRYFQGAMQLGFYSKGDRIFYYQDQETRVMFGSAAHPESLESATAKAAWLDEAGQNQFRLESWEAIQRRVSLYQGRILISTTPYNCYSEDTEIYTRRGWRRFGDLDAQDEVLACGPFGERAHFEKPAEVFWQRYDGPMVHIRGPRVDLLVTPNHRVAYRSGAEVKVAMASDFAAANFRRFVLPKVVDQTGRDAPETFLLPGSPRGHRWGAGVRQSAEPIAIPMGDWCAFMGWYLTEGSVVGSGGGRVRDGMYRVSVAQEPGLKRDRLRADLERLPFRWHEERHAFVTTNKQLWSYLSQFGSSEQKHVPSELKSASPSHLRVLIDRMILGDGTYRRDRQGEFVFYSGSRRLAEDFKEVCTLAGISTHLSERAVRSRIKGHQYVYSMFHVAERKRRGAMVQDCQVEPYAGYVGCVSVSTGFVLVRRNGEELVSGNTGWLKSQVYDKARDGDPDFKVIQFASTMNPAFPEAELERIKRSGTPAWKFRMFYLGQFDTPPGLVYSAFVDTYRESEGHLVRPFVIPHWWPRYIGIDFGGSNTAKIYIAFDPATSVYYVYDEELTGGRIAAQHVEDVLRRMGGAPLAGVWGGSKSESAWRMEFAAAGLPMNEPDISNVEVGIDRTNGLFTHRRLFVFDSCIGLRDELGTYSRAVAPDGTVLEMIINKSMYHRVDALRYVSQGIGGPPEPYPILAMGSARGWQPRALR